MRRIDFIVVHCSDTPNGRWHTVMDIDKWHKDRGFLRQEEWRKKLNPQLKSVGYHYVIDLDGRVESGRHPDEVGAHVKGFNSRSIGICMIGKDRFTGEQWDALFDLHQNLSTRYRDAKWMGHRDFSPDKNGDGTITPDEYMKLCPGFSVYKWLRRDLEEEERHVLVE